MLRSHMRRIVLRAKDAFIKVIRPLGRLELGTHVDLKTESDTKKHTTDVTSDYTAFRDEILRPN